VTMASVQRPSKLSMGPPHPDPIVETASLSAVQPPEPTYKLQIAEQMEELGSLSCLQLETIVYACQRHMQLLSDHKRAGFFLGDGAGVDGCLLVLISNMMHGEIWRMLVQHTVYQLWKVCGDVAVVNCHFFVACVCVSTMQVCYFQSGVA
jgi:hypothetical protein